MRPLPSQPAISAASAISAVPADLEEIADYIASDSPRHALRVLQLLRARMKEIANQPEFYRLRPELGKEAMLATTGQYVILFRIRSNSVRIERVVHGGRDSLPLLEEPESHDRRDD